jgi:asparagine synthase (glutamine-hydrolysing)
MCGIVALVRTNEATTEGGLLQRMTQLVAHRGPDGDGHAWLSVSSDGASDVGDAGAWNVALGHRRLSIIDLSAGGRQPMQRGPLWITFNGEIYNYLELRDTLKKLGHRFESESDTEVLLASYQQWGTDCFARLKGMWGLVLVDGQRQQVIVSRDRLGIKPLYQHRQDGVLTFVSEIKQLTALPAKLRPNLDTLQAYLATGYEDQAHTFFEGVQPLPPGTWASFDARDARPLGRDSYWHPETVVADIACPDEAGEALAAALRQSIKEHLRSDVPVGCALSGGLDSSSVALLVGEHESASLNTFTVLFPGEAIDEQHFVDVALAHLNAKPHFVVPTAQHFLDDFDHFVWQHDEPVGSLSQYAGWAVARLTHEAKVPVTLNGQGGDEVLAGYWQSLFTWYRSLARGGHLLTLVQHVGGAALGGNPEMLRQVPFMLRRYRSRRGSSTLERVLSLTDQQRRVFEIRELHLPRLLRWDDRNFMAFSVEGRYPFLDHQLIELCLRMTPEALYRAGWVKEPLRRGLKSVLPEAIARRRSKVGLETPQASWLRTSLRPRIEAWAAGPVALRQWWPRLDVSSLLDEGLAPGASDEGQAKLFRYWFADAWLKRFC